MNVAFLGLAEIEDAASILAVNEPGKQKTAEPQGAASLSLAVLDSDGSKREGSSEEQCGLWVVRRRGEKLGTERTFGLYYD